MFLIRLFGLRQDEAQFWKLISKSEITKDHLFGSHEVSDFRIKMLQERILALTKSSTASDFLPSFRKYFIGRQGVCHDVDPLSHIAMFANSSPSPWESLQTWPEVEAQLRQSKELITNFNSFPTEGQAALRLSLTAYPVGRATLQDAVEGVELLEKLVKAVNDMKAKCQGLAEYTLEMPGLLKLAPLAAEWRKAQSTWPEEMEFCHFHTAIDRQTGFEHVQVKCVESFLRSIKGLADAKAGFGEEAEMKGMEWPTHVDGIVNCATILRGMLGPTSDEAPSLALEGSFQLCVEVHCQQQIPKATSTNR